MNSVEVIDRPAAAIVALEPVRSQLLALLADEPASATQLAATLGLSRQKVNYHLRALEQHGLVQLAEERQRRGFVERVLRASAESYVVSPAALGDVAADRAIHPDRLSARYLLAVVARAIREVGDLMRGAERAGKPLATLAIDTEIRFHSAAERAAFTDDLTHAVNQLAARYHDETSDVGRWHRFVVFAHPYARQEA